MELEDPIEWIEARCFVNVKPEDTRIRPFYGYVEVANPEAGKVLVKHVGGKFREWFTLDEVRLIYGAEAATVVTAS